MHKFMKAAAALALGTVMTTTVATAADAQRWRGGPGYNRGYYGGGGWGRGDWGRRGGVSSGAAIGIGILGLGLGAAIASQPRYGYYGGGGGYYNGGVGYYGGGPGYYDGYYAGPRCWTQRVWDPYIGRTIRQRVCD